MPCSICKQEGHTKTKCPKPVTLDSAPRAMALSDEIRQKLAKLSSLCSEVARGLGKGYIEGVYQQALCSELQEAGIRHVMEETMPILYKGRPLGGTHSQRLDVMLLNYLPFIYELKAVSKPICPEHHWQLVRYMTYKSQPFGAVVNFNQSDKGSLEIQFIVLQGTQHFLYDPETQEGTPLIDYSMRPAVSDGWEEAWE